MKAVKNKIHNDNDDKEEPAVRKMTRLAAIDEEAEHDKAECSDEERIRQEEEKDEDEESEADTEIVPPSIDEDDNSDAEGYRPEAPMTADEYMDGLLKAADATNVFKETYFPALKKHLVKVCKYKLPWYDELACTNERFCADDGCDTSNRYPAWAWCMMRCAMKNNSRNTGRVVITFEPVSRRVYVVADESRFGKPIQLRNPEDGEWDQVIEVNRVVFEVRKKLEQVAALGRGLTDIEDG